VRPHISHFGFSKTGKLTVDHGKSTVDHFIGKTHGISIAMSIYWRGIFSWENRQKNPTFGGKNGGFPLEVTTSCGNFRLCTEHCLPQLI